MYFHNSILIIVTRPEVLENDWDISKFSLHIPLLSISASFKLLLLIVYRITIGTASKSVNMNRSVLVGPKNVNFFGISLAFRQIAHLCVL